MEALVAHSRELAKHAYGNYVVQHILEHGSPDQRHRIILAVEADICELSADPYGCAVAAAVVCCADRHDKVRLASSILMRPGLLGEMSITRHGYVAVKKILHALDGRLFELARQSLDASHATLSASRYGRNVLASLA